MTARFKRTALPLAGLANRTQPPYEVQQLALNPSGCNVQAILARLRATQGSSIGAMYGATRHDKAGLVVSLAFIVRVKATTGE